MRVFEEVADFEVDVWEYTLSAVTARPLRGVRSLKALLAGGRCCFRCFPAEKPLVRLLAQTLSSGIDFRIKMKILATAWACIAPKSPKLAKEQLIYRQGLQNLDLHECGFVCADIHVNITVYQPALSVDPF